MDEFDLHVERGNALWFVTSPQIRGLLACGRTCAEAIAGTPKALDDLEAALTLGAKSEDTKQPAAWPPKEAM